ncbi:Transmembrane domain-containing protein [Cedratvirus Zaza IHUMI]|uniref:Transmembrane domain-containing protein n=1 Tax=Cedratvirus Zaza IHUMI TaxID=2126979 RepID=A0A2R8FEC3_9VIRU|nr:Transmembrane domain-containing protein [Cedratvirus Zaza IHUMI]
MSLPLVSPLQESRDCCLRDCSYSQCSESNPCSVTSASCSTLMNTICLGTTGSVEDWNRAWTQSSIPGRSIPDCVYYLSRSLLRETSPVTQDIAQTRPPASLFRDSAIISQARDFMRQVFNNLTQRGYLLGSAPNSRTFNSIEFSLYNVCRNVPGVCSSYLQDFCSTYNGQVILSNPSLAKWCGCYLPDQEYARYVNEYSVNKECTPYCIREESVPLANPAGNSFLTCAQNVCILDDVAISLQNSSVRGGANFRQICGDCGSGGRCSCVTSNINLTLVNSQVQGIDFTQNCSAQTSRCTRRVGSVELEVPCQTGDSVEQEAGQAYEKALRSRNLRVFFSILGAIFLVLVVIVVLYALY